MDSTNTATCQACKRSFILNQGQCDFVNTLQGEGLSFIMIECPNCGTSTQYIEEAHDKSPLYCQDDAYRCPLSHCSGWVLLIDHSDSFFGCGKCGSIWYNEENLNDAITHSIVNYPYRQSCYKKDNGKWLATPIESQPDNYEELVELEPFDHTRALIRG